MKFTFFDGTEGSIRVTVLDRVLLRALVLALIWFLVSR